MTGESENNPHHSDTIEPTDVPEKRDVIGPLAFVLMSAAVLVFFWWLLIYDHGVVAMD